MDLTWTQFKYNLKTSCHIITPIITLIGLLGNTLSWRHKKHCERTHTPRWQHFYLKQIVEDIATLFNTRINSPGSFSVDTKGSCFMTWFWEKKVCHCCIQGRLCFLVLIDCFFQSCSLKQIFCMRWWFWTNIRVKDSLMFLFLSGLTMFVFVFFSPPFRPHWDK